MKNKIRCLFDKITFEDLLGIFGICICSLLIFTMVFAPISASAASYFPQTVILNNPANTPFVSCGVVYAEQNDLGTFSTAVGSILTCNYPARQDSLEPTLFTVENGVINGVAFDTGSIPDGTYYAVFYSFVEGSNAAILPYNEPDYFGLYINYDIITYFYLDESTDNSIDILPVDTSVTGGECIKLVPADNTDPPVECPTLQTQINQYSGTWSSFVDIIQANNNILYGEYISTLYSWRDDGANSVTLEQRFEEFEGDFDDLMEGLRISNPRLYEQYNSLIDETLQQGRDFGYSLGYNEGYDVGESDGYKNGQNDGYNKGASDSLVQNFFGNFLQGVVQAVDSIHFYEVIDDNGTPDPKDDIVEFYISPWTILIVFIGLALVLIFLKVWRGG